MKVEVRPSTGLARPTVRGKFLFRGDGKIYLRGVTYGSFRAGSDGVDFPPAELVQQDFAQMAASGVNAVRTYTVPPGWLLDAAHGHGLSVMVGLPWEQHVTFLDDRSRARSIERRVRDGARACAGHPALLSYAIGNEIPASIVRWHGRRRVEAFLRRLHSAVKEEDPDSLVTYVNYPSTEYLQLPFLDFACFNVYLESQELLRRYLDRLQNVVGDVPLVLSELGLDSRRHGEAAQARSLEWQLQTTFSAGCAGAFVFSWTDEWHRGGHDVEDWDFGLTGRDRREKGALAAVRDVYGAVPFLAGEPCPRVSIVLCAYNASSTIRECLEGLQRLEYPSFEVIVVDDGSSDDTAAIASEYDVRLLRTENRGLSAARNAGLEAATGEIVAYLDADAYPDPHWLTYLTATFRDSSYAAVGGPNLPPPSDGVAAAAVARAPGGPIHVLLSDREAEHIPGCNMAFRKECLQAIGGFDEQFRVAGDDVDVCWRLEQAGLTLGFSPAAVVWHHRRNSVRAYLRQQFGYGKAEALLERKWPERYNRGGHLSWVGHVYGNGSARPRGWGRWRIYYGTWGTALFQPTHHRAAGLLASLPRMPEWYLLVLAFLGLSALGMVWSRLFLVLPLLLLVVALPLSDAVLGGFRASCPSSPTSRGRRLLLRAVISLLFAAQPLARLSGRLRSGLVPWRKRRVPSPAFPRLRTRTSWSERWRSLSERLEWIEAKVRSAGLVVLRASEYDRWDLEVRGGTLGVARLRTAVEEHGGGRQLVRIRSWPKPSRGGLAAILTFGTLALAAALDGAWAAGAILVLLAAAVAAMSLLHCATATAVVLSVLDQLRECEDEELPTVLRGQVAAVGSPSLAHSNGGRPASGKRSDKVAAAEESASLPSASTSVTRGRPSWW